MKKLITLSLIAFLIASCVSIKSVVDSSVIEEFYKNPLIVILYQKYSTKNFSKQLKKNLETEFVNANKKIEFLLLEQARSQLELNPNNDSLNYKINKAIITGQNDLVLIFSPTNLTYVNEGLQSATYELTGIDVDTKKEVWKASFSSSSSFGPSLFAVESAKTIFKRLNTDKVL